MSWLVFAKVALVLLLARLALYGMRRAAAAARHLVVVVALVAALLIPVLEPVLPSWAILPAPVSSPLADGAKIMGVLPGEGLAAEPGSDTVRAPQRAVPSHRAGPDDVSGLSFDPRRLLTILWLGGALALLLLLVARCALMTRIARRARSVRDPAWRNLLTTARSTLLVRAPVELKLRGAGSMPAVWGIRRPVLLLPADCMDWPAARRRDVLMHELAHVRRRDVVALILGHVVCALHWFNPLAWMLRNRLALECELACDDLALSQGTPASQYADHLLVTATACRTDSGLAPVMAAPSQLEGRIMAILDNDRNREAVSWLTRIATVTVAAAALLPLATLSWAKEDRAASPPAVKSGWHAGSDSARFAVHLTELGIDTEDVDALLDALSAADPLTRGASAWALGRSGDERVIDPLIRAGDDPDAVVRQWVVRSLAGWDAPRIAPLLIGRLQDDDAEVRQWAVRSLAQHDDAVRTQPLIGSLNDPDAEVREWVARVLADTDDPTVTNALTNRLLIENDAAAGEWLVRALGDRADPQSIDALTTALGSTSADVREWAVRSLGRFEDPAIVTPVIAMLDDDNPEVREWAARVLARYDDEQVTDALAGRVTAETDDEVGEWLVRSLGERGGAQSTDALRNALYSEHAEVRQWAIRGLDGVRDDRTIDALIAMLNDRDDEVREWSVRVLGFCGNQRAVAPLQTLTQDPNEEIREWVDRALQEIRC